MSVLRSLNVMNQMRVDVPHLRLLESGVAGDFDTVVGRILSGARPLIYKGFTVSGQGGPASELVMSVADGVAANLNGTASGSFLYVPADRPSEVLDAVTNSRVQGSFVASSTNYIGIDFVRVVDESTSDVVVFKNPTTGTETSRTVPLAKVMDYRIVISTTPFSANANIIPVAKAITDASNTVTTLTDARNLAFRLGVGGDFPSSASTYAWPQGRTESSFSGGDKSITSFKEWSEAIMARLWEVGGGSSWFSPTADRNVEFTNYGTPDPTSGEYFTFNSGTGAVSWQGIRFLFDGEAATFNEVEPDSGTILDGECIYVDLDRTTDRVEGVNGLVAQIGDLNNLGVGNVPGSRWVMAWRVGTSLYTRNWRYPVGTTFQPATTGALGVVLLNETPASALTPAVVAIRSGGGIRVIASSGVAAEFRATTNSALNGFTNAATPDGYAAIGGIGLGANNYGVWGTGSGNRAGIRGDTSVGSTGPGVEGEANTSPGVGVKGTYTPAAAITPVLAGAESGVWGRGNKGVTGHGVFFGVVGESDSGVGIFGYSDAGNGIEGASGGAAHGVQGSTAAALFAGVFGQNTVGYGVVGNGAAAGINGVGTGNGHGGVFTGSGTGRAIDVVAGDIGLPPANVVEYSATKTGYVWISANEFIRRGTVAGVQLQEHSFGGGVFAGWVFGASAETLSCQVRVPRGATITELSLYFDNASGGALTTTTLDAYAIAGNPPARTNLYAPASISIPNGVGFVTPVITPYAVAAGSSATDSSMVLVNLNGINGSLHFGGIRVTYTYTIIDFMV